jgi:hypothetical protein
LPMARQSHGGGQAAWAFQAGKRDRMPDVGYISQQGLRARPGRDPGDR